MNGSGRACSTKEVLAFCAYFEPGVRAGGPIRSVGYVLTSVGTDVHVTLVTNDRDLGDVAPYPGLSGRLVSWGRHHVFYWSSGRLLSVPRLLHQLGHRNFDVLYVNSFWSPGFSLLPLLLRRIGLIKARRVMVAPRGEFTVGALSLKRLKKRAFLPIYRFLAHEESDVWHVSSDDEAGDVQRLFPGANYVVQPASRGPEPRGSIVPSGDVARVVYLSRIHPAKNLALVLKGLYEVSGPVVFHIYGPTEDDNYWQRCRSLIESLPKNIECRYVGQARPDKTIDLLSVYDAMLLPTLGENFGHAIAESLAAGCSVFCSERTPWTPVLLSGGGEVLPLEARAWALAVEGLVESSPSVRTLRKKRALAAYRSWRGAIPDTTALDMLLARE